MAKRFKVDVEFKGTDKVSGAMSKMQRSVSRFGSKSGRVIDKMDRKVRQLSKGFNKLALVGAAGFALLSAGALDVVKTGIQFEQSLVNAAAKFPGQIRQGTKAFQMLEDAAKKTGRTTEFTASQSAEALNFLAMAGFSAESAIAALPGVVDLATASQTDLATATDIATDSMGAFGLLTDDAAQAGKNLARINDVIAKTSTTANTNVEQLFEAIKDGAPIATTAGASLETFATLAGVMANAGIKGSRAGTTLKNIFVKLAAPTKEAGNLLQRMGVQTKDANGDLRDVVDIFEDLDKGLAGLGTAERSGVLEGIFGKIPLAGVNVLLKEGSQGLREYRSELEGASGASSQMAEMMRGTTLGSLKALGSAIEGVKIELFGATKGPFKDLVDWATTWVRDKSPAIVSSFNDMVAVAVEFPDALIERMGDLDRRFFTPIGVAIDSLTESWRAFKGELSAGLEVFTDPQGLTLKTLEEFARVPGGPGGGFEFGIPTAQNNPFLEQSAPTFSPQERTENIRTERQENTTRVVIEDATGRAAIQSGSSPAGVTLMQTGGFE